MAEHGLDPDGGRPRRWHPVTVEFAGGPRLSEAEPATFRDHRLDVTFRHADGTTLVVPGYFAGDGDAADSGAAAGRVWRAHLSPPKAGEWTYTASFVAGDGVALARDPEGLGRGVAFDGASDSFTVLASDKEGADFRGQGWLIHRPGDRYLTFSGTGEAFLKGGPGSPENFLAYEGFDGTVDRGRKPAGGPFLHAYGPHRADARPGDPTWDGENGTGEAILGALNYLGRQGLTSLYVIANTFGGDGGDVWPWVDPEAPRTYDVSKLDQWRIVFEHAQTRGIHIELFGQETENDQDLDGGALGADRKLYYRELVARFAHVNGLTWNLGEENTNTPAQRAAFARWIRDLDEYGHPVAVHTGPALKDEVFGPLLGTPVLDGPSLQGGDGHGETLRWVEASAAAGRPWVVSFDEFGGAARGVPPDAADPGHDAIRAEYLWGHLMAGGAGLHYYVGYTYPQNDLTLENFATLEGMWAQNRHALAFFRDRLPFERMAPADALLPQNAGLAPDEVEDYALATAARGVVAVYLRDGGTTRLDLRGAPGWFEVDWYDPREGGALREGDVAYVRGGAVVGLGRAPGDPALDHVALVRRVEAPPADRFDLRVADGPDRDGAAGLDGAALSGPAFVFLDAGTVSGVARVRFEVDGEVVRTGPEGLLDLDGLGAGAHELAATVLLGDGRRVRVDAGFTVEGGAADLPLAGATADGPFWAA